jgi:hypothetical protein
MEKWYYQDIMPDIDNKDGLSVPKKVVRTYSSDLAKSVQEKGGEAYRIARVEEGIKDHEAKILAKQRKMNLIWGLSGLGLIVAGLAAFAYFSSRPKVILNPEPSIQAQSIIFFDSSIKINVIGLDYDKILIAYRKSIAETKIPAGRIEVIDFIEGGQKISLSRFFNLLRISPPKEAASFWDKNYLLGVFADEKGNWPFMILRTNSYRDISPQIIKWEDHMIDDISALLNVDVTGKNNYLLQSKWSDLIISNKETRVIKDASGEVVLLYVYPDENTILFARNKNTLDEILLRLFSPKK